MGCVYEERQATSLMHQIHADSNFFKILTVLNTQWRAALKGRSGHLGIIASQEVPCQILITSFNPGEDLSD